MNRVHANDYRIVRETLSALSTARALCVWILFKHKEYDQIINLSFNPLDYNDVNDARDALAATEFLRKTDNLPTSVDKKSVALKAFYAAEDVCRSTNDAITDLVCDERFVTFRRKISHILRSVNAEEFLELSGWGPGVTLTLRGSDATLFNKFNHDGELTPLCHSFIKPWFSIAFPLWDIKPRYYEGNRVITVPKNAKTDRVIAVEPSLNLFFQKGVGGMIRSRLASIGIDLKDQRHNQRLARLGSKFNSLATIDFSAASDTICWRLVFEALPLQWFDLLYALRSARGLIGDSLIEYEKFSSMGNGYTFELESLIFYCAALAVTPEDHPCYDQISIYGDDVIIPSDRADHFTEFCSLLGFTVNTQKSYSSGYYRESCGKHYWDGVDITPFYLRTLPGDNIDELFKIHNAIFRYSSRILDGYHLDRRFRPVIHFIRSIVPAKYRYYIPDDFGDGGLVAHFDIAVPPRNRRYQRGFNVRHRCFIPRTISDDRHCVLLTRLYNRSIDRQDGNDTNLPRNGNYRTLTSYVPLWSDHGPWI